MGTKEDQILRTAKEIIVKFIETGRIYPTNFRESFRMIYNAVNDTVENATTKAPDAERENE